MQQWQLPNVSTSSWSSASNIRRVGSWVPTVVMVAVVVAFSVDETVDVMYDFGPQLPSIRCLGQSVGRVEPSSDIARSFLC
jgi:hypothetical protein